MSRTYIPSYNLPYIQKTVDYTVTDDNYVVDVDASSSAITITLPTAIGRAGKVFTIKKTDSSGNSVTVSTTSSQTIDGVTSETISTQYHFVKVISDGANWLLVGRSQGLVRYTGPGELTNSAGVIKHLKHSSYSIQSGPADGDLFYLYFILDGTETKLNIATVKDTDRGIWRWKLNNLDEDATDYDDYAASVADVYREIDLTGLTRPAENILRLRVNGKNASSSQYFLGIYGVSIH